MSVSSPPAPPKPKAPVKELILPRERNPIPQARTPRQVYEDNRPPKHILLRWRFKCALILCGFHGKCHEVARIQRELRAYSRATMMSYAFWQGEHGADLNRWRMK